jgi:hypothetical protein
MMSETEMPAAESELPSIIREELAAQFGENADITVYDVGDHLDIRVLPNDVKDDLESEHDLTVVPYNALRLTVRRDN